MISLRNRKRERERKNNGDTANLSSCRLRIGGRCQGELSCARITAHNRCLVYALAALTMRAISRCEHSRSDACVSLNECDEFKARGARYAENALTSWLVVCSKMVRGCREICLPSSKPFEAGKEDRIKKVERRGKRVTLSSRAARKRNGGAARRNPCTLLWKLRT